METLKFLILASFSSFSIFSPRCVLRRSQKRVINGFEVAVGKLRARFSRNFVEKISVGFFFFLLAQKMSLGWYTFVSV